MLCSFLNKDMNGEGFEAYVLFTLPVNHNGNRTRPLVVTVVIQILTDEPLNLSIFLKAKWVKSLMYLVLLAVIYE